MPADHPKSEYEYTGPAYSDLHTHLLPVISTVLNQYANSKGKKIFDLGCGNGSVASWLTKEGYIVSGCDISESGIAIAKQQNPSSDLRVASVYDNIREKFGESFPLVVSFDVIEHLYSPRTYAKNVFDLLEPGGSAIISTPYHGYFKNLVISLLGKWDQHFTALWDHGHIKFWSEKTIRVLLEDAGLEIVEFRRAGRISILAMSMIVVCRRPLSVK